MMLNFLFLSNLIICAYSAECNESSWAAEVVQKCPMKAVEWKQRETVKNCSAKSQTCTSKETLKYHCVRNSLLTKLIEVCSPVWISAGYCVEFDEKGKVIQDNYHEPCTSVEPKCRVGYPSTQMYIYPKCYELKANPKEDNDSYPYSNRSSGTEVTIEVMISIGIVFFFLIVFVIVSIVNRYRKKKKGNGPQLTSKLKSPPLEMDNYMFIDLVNMVSAEKYETGHGNLQGTETTDSKIQKGTADPIFMDSTESIKSSKNGEDKSSEKKNDNNPDFDNYQSTENIPSEHPTVDVIKDEEQDEKHRQNKQKEYSNLKRSSDTYKHPSSTSSINSQHSTSSTDPFIDKKDEKQDTKYQLNKQEADNNLKRSSDTFKHPSRTSLINSQHSASSTTLIVDEDLREGKEKHPKISANAKES